METITYNDFAKIELRSGTVVRAESFPEARNPAHKVWVDFGQFGVLQTSAQITDHYSPQSLIGRQVVGCINLGVKKIAGFESQFLLVGFYDPDNRICLVTTDLKVPNGMKLC
jgi:tRNA-binding protein